MVASADSRSPVPPEAEAELCERGARQPEPRRTLSTGSRSADRRVGRRPRLGWPLHDSSRYPPQAGRPPAPKGVAWRRRAPRSKLRVFGSPFPLLEASPSTETVSTLSPPSETQVTQCCHAPNPSRTFSRHPPKPHLRTPSGFARPAARGESSSARAPESPARIHPPGPVTVQWTPERRGAPCQGPDPGRLKAPWNLTRAGVELDTCGRGIATPHPGERMPAFCWSVLTPAKAGSQGSGAVSKRYCAVPSSLPHKV